MYRVLIADDEPIERMVLSKKLKELFAGKIEVVQAENGTDALEFYQENDCRIAILDINMPGMNGLEVARRLRSQSRDNILIFLTAYDEFDYAKQAVSVRALDYLLKPGTDQEIETAIDEALRLVEEQDENRKKWTELERANQMKGDAVQTPDRPEEPERREIKEEIPSFESLQQDDKTGDNIRMRAIAGEILAYIDENYQRDISLQDISGSLGYSEAHFCKIFRQCFSKSFTGYLTEYRIKIAKQLLGDVKINIKDISAQIGVRDSNYFARVFKRYTGCSPSEYRNSIL